MAPSQPSRCHVMDFLMSDWKSDIDRTVFEDPLQLSLLAPLVLLITFLTLFVSLEQIFKIRVHTPPSSPKFGQDRARSKTPKEVFKSHEKSVTPEWFECSATPQTPEFLQRGRSVTPERQEAMQVRPRLFVPQTIEPNGISQYSHKVCLFVWLTFKFGCCHTLHQWSNVIVSYVFLQTRQPNQSLQFPFDNIKQEICNEDPSEQNSGSLDNDSLVKVHRKFSHRQNRTPGVLLDCRGYNAPDAQVIVSNIHSEESGWDLSVQISEYNICNL